MEKKSLHLVVEDQREFAKNLPDLQVSDTALPEFRENIVAMIKSFSPEAPLRGKRIQINSDVSVLIYNSDKRKKRPAIYYIHGGGFISGTADMYDATHQERANKLDAVIVAIDYRLAPEFPFPTPLQDCLLGLEWFYENLEELGVDAEKLTLMGESAGGGLTAALNLYVKDKTNIRPKNQVLIYPMLDYTTSKHPETYPNSYVGEFLWTHHLNQYAWNAYKGSSAIAEQDIGYFSPLHAHNLSGLPPTYIMVGSLDLFLEEDIEYAKRLCRAGISITLDVVAGVIHGFDALSTDTATAYNQRLYALLEKIL